MQNIPLDSEAFGAVWRRVNMQSYEKSFSDTEFLQQVINSTFQKAKQRISFIFPIYYAIFHLKKNHCSQNSKVNIS